MVQNKRAWGIGASAAALVATMLGLSSQAPASGAPSAATSATPAATTAATTAAEQTSHGVKHVAPLGREQQRELRKIARRSWQFYADDVDPSTHLPLDNLTYAGGSTTPTDRGTYTSSANIGQYMWALVSASDLHLITKREATRKARQTLRTVSNLDQFHGFLFQWYDTDNASACSPTRDRATAPRPAARSTTARSSRTSTTGSTPRVWSSHARRCRVCALSPPSCRSAWTSRCSTTTGPRPTAT